MLVDSEDRDEEKITHELNAQTKAEAIGALGKGTSRAGRTRIFAMLTEMTLQDQQEFALRLK